MLIDKELQNRIESYFKAHNFDTSLLSCGACGIRNYESENDTASIKYTRVSLESLLKVYAITTYQMKNLDDWMKEGVVTIPKGYSSNNENIS